GRAISTGRPALSTDYDELGNPVPHEAYAEFASAVVAPMRSADGTRGVLGVGTRDEERIFTERDAELLEAFASLAALALRTAEGLGGGARQARIERGFYRIASILGSPLSLAETLDAVAEAAAEALGGAFAALLMPAGDTLELRGAFVVPDELAAALREGL